MSLDLAPTLPDAPAEPAVLTWLRDPASLTRRILADEDPGALVPTLVAASALGAGLFGLAVGLQGGIAQAALAAIKLPIVLLVSAGISLPVLHVSCALAGLRLRFEQLSALVLHALFAASATMAGLAPLVVVASLTLSSAVGADACDAPPCPETWWLYRRVFLAVCAIAGASGVVGAARLLRTIPLSAALPWSVAFGLAGLQLCWLLRPLVGMPGRTVLLRSLEGNGPSAILEALHAVLS